METLKHNIVKIYGNRGKGWLAELPRRIEQLQCSWGLSELNIKGYPTVCKEFERKQEADDWKLAVTRKIKAGQFQFDQHKIQRTFSDLVEHFIQSGALEEGKNLEDIMHYSTGIESLGTKEGAIGIFTQNRLNREQVLTQMAKVLFGQYFY